jgi:tetratricopeptide (TPR) repeat protein
MKKVIAVLILGIAFSSLYAQKEKPEALLYDGNKAFNTQQYALALSKYEKALAVWGKKPADQAMIYNMGVCAYHVKDINKSEKYIDMTLAAGYNLDMAYQYKACIMQARNNQEGYLNTLKEGLNKVPGSKAMKESLAKHYFEEGDKHYHAAKDIMAKTSEMVKSGKMKSTDKTFKDENSKARAEFNEAIKLMDQALKVNPEYENARIIKKNSQNQVNLLL